MDTWQTPAAAHRLPTTATCKWRAGMHNPQPTTQPKIQLHCLAPDIPRSNFQAFFPFSPGVSTKQTVLSGLDSTAGPCIDHKAQSSKPLNVLRHQSCPVLIPKWLQLCSQTPPVPSGAAAPVNEQEFINPQLSDCCQLCLSPTAPSGSLLLVLKKCFSLKEKHFYCSCLVNPSLPL